jgi:hypothetical protein
VLKDIIQVCNASLKEVIGRPIRLVSTRRVKFLERIKSKSCKWVRWMGMPGQRVSDSRDGSPVGASVEGELHLSWMQMFPSPFMPFILFFFFQEASQGTLPWLGGNVRHKHFTEMRRLAHDETPFLLAMPPRATTLAW